MQDLWNQGIRANDPRDAGNRQLLPKSGDLQVRKELCRGYELKKNKKTMNKQEIESLKSRIDMLGFDYQRMSQSGQQVYDSIYKTLHKTLDKQDYENK